MDAGEPEVAAGMSVMQAEYRSVVTMQPVAPEGYGLVSVGTTKPGDLELDDKPRRIKDRTWKPARQGLSCAIGIVIARPVSRASR
jgi:hypothetical protein